MSYAEKPFIDIRCARRKISQITISKDQLKRVSVGNFRLFTDAGREQCIESSNNLQCPKNCQIAKFCAQKRIEGLDDHTIEEE